MKQMILAKQTIRKEMSFPMGCFARIIFASCCFLQKRKISQALVTKAKPKLLKIALVATACLLRLLDSKLKKSELQEYDWIRTYTELAFLRENNNIHVKEPERSRLAILKVAVESLKPVERPKDRLKARNATFY